MPSRTYFRGGYALAFSAALIFTLIFVAALNIPFHSDDYSYFLQGLSVERRISHYMGWSGRLITDFTSSYLLNLFSQPVYTAINSVVFVTFLVSISLLPYVVFRRQKGLEGSALMLWLLFTTYWLSNPRLGHTSFWLVGSANYIWPLMWAGFYLLFIFYLLSNDKKLDVKAGLLLSVLGLFAGLSNESTGVSMVLLSFGLIFLYKNQRNIAINGFVATLAGFLVLYLSPGNHGRLAHKAFAEWGEKSLFAKVFDHLVYRMPTAISRYWFAIVIALVLLFIIRRYKTQLVNVAAKNKLFFSTCFFVLAVFSVLVFVHSPTMPRRSLNTGLYFILIGIAFLTSHLLGASDRKINRWLTALVASCLVLFISSYVLFYNAMASTKIQHQIREEVILNAKAEGRDVAAIPDWYFTRLLRRHDRFDTFRSSAMPRYYGVKDIVWEPAFFDYSILKSQLPVAVDKDLMNGLVLRSMYVYKEFASSKDGLIWGFNQPLVNYARDGEDVLSVRVYKKGQTDAIDADVRIADVTRVGDNYYYRINLKKPDLDDIDRISFGFYNSKTKEQSASFELDASDLYDGK